MVNRKRFHLDRTVDRRRYHWDSRGDRRSELHERPNPRLKSPAPRRI